MWMEGMAQDIRRTTAHALGVSSLDDALTKDSTQGREA